MRLAFLTRLDGMSERVYVRGLHDAIGAHNVHFGLYDDIDYDDYDIVLVGRDVLESRTFRPKLINKIASTGDSIDFAVLDCYDDLLVDRLILNGRIRAYFKREIPAYPLRGSILWRYALWIGGTHNPGRYVSYPELVKLSRTSPSKLKPIMLSYLPEDNFRPASRKTYSVSVIANLHPAEGSIFHKFFRYNTWKSREKVAAVCKSYEGSFVRVGYFRTGGGMSHSGYLNTISESLCSVAPVSASFDTIRYWEIPYAGTVLISERTKIIRPHNFVEGEHAFFYDNRGELRKVLERQIKDKNESLAMEMGKKARAFVIKEHSPEARGKQIIETIKISKEFH